MNVALTIFWWLMAWLFVGLLLAPLIGRFLRGSR